MPAPRRHRYAAPVRASFASVVLAVSAVLVTAGCTAAGPSASGDPSPSPEEPTSAAPAAAPGEGTVYCDALGGGLADLFASIQGPGGVGDAMARVRTVIRQAPTPVADEWRRLGAATDEVEATLTDLAVLRERADAGEITQRRLRRRSQDLLAGLDTFDTPRNARAVDRVARHAERHCGVGLAP